MKQHAHCLQALTSSMRAPLDGAPPNTLRLTLHPAGPGVYPSKVVLVSDGDVRLLDVEFVAVRTSQEVTLEFNNPARDKLLQEVDLACLCCWLYELFHCLSELVFIQCCQTLG